MKIYAAKPEGADRDHENSVHQISLPSTPRLSLKDSESRNVINLRYDKVFILICDLISVQVRFFQTSFFYIGGIGCWLKRLKFTQLFFHGKEQNMNHIFSVMEER